MKRSQKKLFRILSFVSGTLLVVQSLLPGFFAIQKLNADDETSPTPQQEQVQQETIPAPQPSQEPIADPTEALKPADTPATTDTPTPTPAIIESALTPTLTETPAPTSEPSATPSSEQPQPASEDQTNVSETGPPKEESSSPASETTPAPSITPSPAPTPTEIEKVCSTEVTNQTSTFDWDIDSGRELAQTRDTVTLGTKYVYPYDSGVSVTFTCLPKDETLRTQLKIERVKVSDLKLPDGVRPDGDYAYDITTGMANGTFTYTVTLPKTEGKTADVSYIEKSINELKNQEGSLKAEDVKDVEKSVIQEGTFVKVEGIDHFTVWFSVDTYADSGVSIPKDTFALGDTVYAKGTSSSKKTIRLQFQNPSDTSVKDCTSVYAKETTCFYTPTVATPGTWHVVLQSWDDDHDHWDSEKTADFTVSPPPCSAKTYTLEGQRYGDGYVTGNLCNGPSCWAEGDSVPARLTIGGLTAGKSYSVKVQHDYLRSGTVGYENFNTPTSLNATGVAFTALPNSDCGGGVTCKNYTLSFTASSATVQINWIALLGDDAADWPGASLQYRLTEGACGECVGDKTIPVNPKHKVYTGTLQVLKNVDLTGDGDFADAGETGATDWEWQATAGLTTISGHTGDPATTVPIGDYTLSETMKSGFHFNNLDCTGGTFNEYTKTVTVGKNAAVVCTFENLINTVSISGYKWNDRNGDGSPWVWDFWPFWGHWEPKLPNWTIFIDKNGDGVLNGSEVSTTTDANGDYHFNVIPGTYSVCEVVQSGWSNTYPGVCQTVTISKSDCHDKTDINFGNKEKPPETGTITIVKNAEPATTTPFTYTYSPNPYPIGDFTLHPTTGTDSTTFTSIPAGTYVWTEQTVTGWDIKSITCQDSKTWNSTSDPVTGVITVNLEAGETVTCTYVNRQRGSISGTKWNDMDGDGVKDAGEPGLPNWTINLDANADGIVDSTAVTDGSGQYKFENLRIGTYRLREVAQPGWTQTSTNPADITITSGANVTDVDFGNFKKASVQGCKYEDKNGDGTRQSETESQIPNWTMKLYNSDWVFQGESVTGSYDGGTKYHFDGFLPGTYYICEEKRAGWTQTGPTGAAGVANASPNKDNEGGFCYAITITTSGQTIMGKQFGNQYVPPKLEISKINNAAGNLHPGDSVLYTITVKALDNLVYNVKVADLLPAGFVFRPGSATQDGNPANFDHEYASPGTWSLGDLAKDQTVTLTLIADIASSQHPGTYKDLALSYGCALGEEECSGTDEVVASAVDPGKVIDTFAGTDVTVIKDDEPSADAKIVKDETKEEKKETTGEVLGASTTLPATGSDTKWIALIVLFVISGVGMIVAGKKMTRRYHA